MNAILRDSVTARRVYVFLLTLATLAYLVPRWLSPPAWMSPPGPTDAALPAPRALLAAVPVAPGERHRVVGYEREAFGDGWGMARVTGLEHCTSREAALAVQSRPRATGCEPAAVIEDFYGDTRVFSFERLEADHVFPLAAAWDMGAWAWDDARRVEFANDPLNLVITTRAANQDKSDQLPSRWMPPARTRHCWYAQRLAAVAHAYALALPAADHRALRHACRL